MNRIEQLWKLFIATFSVSATTSGGHAITAVLKSLFVEKYKWLEEDEFMNLISIGQATPGSIAINVSVILGYRVAGLPGAIVTMIGTTIPPFAFMLLVTIFYEKIVGNQTVTYFMSGMQASVTALLLFVTLESFRMNKKECKTEGYVLMAVAFIYAMFTDFSLLFLFVFVMIVTYIRTVYLTRFFR